MKRVCLQPAAYRHPAESSAHVASLSILTTYRKRKSKRSLAVACNCETEVYGTASIGKTCCSGQLKSARSALTLMWALQDKLRCEKQQQEPRQMANNCF